MIGRVVFAAAAFVAGAAIAPLVAILTPFGLAAFAWGEYDRDEGGGGEAVS